MVSERGVRSAVAGVLLLYFGVTAQPFSVEKIAVGKCHNFKISEINMSICVDSIVPPVNSVLSVKICYVFNYFLRNTE